MILSIAVLSNHSCLTFVTKTWRCGVQHPRGSNPLGQWLSQARMCEASATCKTSGAGPLFVPAVFSTQVEVFTHCCRIEHGTNFNAKTHVLLVLKSCTEVMLLPVVSFQLPGWLNLLSSSSSLSYSILHFFPSLTLQPTLFIPCSSSLTIILSPYLFFFKL